MTDEEVWSPTGRCLICCCDDIEFNADEGTTYPDLPINAVVVTIPGNYGSQLYAPSGSEYLTGYLCDGCLSERIKGGFIQRVQVANHETRIRHPYTVPGG